MKIENNRRDFIKKSALGIGTAFLTTNSLFAGKTSIGKPNILWIVSEDNSSSYIGCYGNKQATTPNIDNLAKEGILYENAYANAPVCAPMRHTLITGMYACKTGCHNMRSKNPIPETIKFYPQFLRDAGYYCTNNSKEDYNTINTKNIWNESSGNAHYKNRKKGQPFFAIFNTSLSHEHKIHFHEQIDLTELKHDPNSLEIAPYHPDTPEIRRCYANYYDYISKMDAKVGELIKELKDNGLAEDTIIFYYSDHGGVLPRSKRFLFESGTKIPMIVKFPKKYQHLALSKPGSKNDKLVSIIDLPPTLCSLTNIDIPEQFQGKAFLGKKVSNDPEYLYFFRNRMDERYDIMRSVRDKKYRYIRNYMPHRKYGQHLYYLWKSTSTRSWEETFKNGKCDETQSRFWGYKEPEELYDIAKDPHNINNLANNPVYKKILKSLRKVNSQWIRKNRDAGFIPEGIMVDEAGNKTIFEMIQSKNYPIEDIIEMAEMASSKDAKHLTKLAEGLTHNEPAVRYWAASGCTILDKEAEPMIGKLKKLLKDPVADVRIAAAEGLCKLGLKKESLNLLIKEMKSKNPHSRLHAINVMDALEDDANLVLKELINWRNKETDSYFRRAYIQLIKKLKPGWEDYTI